GLTEAIPSEPPSLARLDWRATVEERVAVIPLVDQSALISYRCGAQTRLVYTMLCQHAPGDSSQLVGESCSQHIMVQALSRRGKPRSIAVPHPVPWPQQNDASSLHEEHAKVAIAALGDTPEDRSIPCGYLLWDQTEPSSKIAATCESSSIADRGDDGA